MLLQGGALMNLTAPYCEYTDGECDCPEAGPCRMCGGWAPCDCDALRLAGAEECDRLWAEMGTVGR